MKLYGFAFQTRNISCRVLYQLANIDNRYLLWGENTINKYVEVLIQDQPEFILGLGIYTGRDRDKVRIETKCTNKFKKRFLDSPEEITIEINPFLKPLELSKYADVIGNSYCNLVSYKIMKEIKNGNLKSKYTFLHIPKNMKTEIAVSEISSLLELVNESLGIEI